MEMVPRVGLGLITVFNLGRGSIHAFEEGSGLEIIAGYDFSVPNAFSADMINFMMVVGFEQIKSGIIQAVLISSYDYYYWVQWYWGLMTSATLVQGFWAN